MVNENTASSQEEQTNKEDGRLESQVETLDSVVEEINDEVEFDTREVNADTERIEAVLDSIESDEASEIKNESASNLEEAYQDVKQFQDVVDDIVEESLSELKDEEAAVVIPQELMTTYEEVEKEREERREDWSGKEDANKESIIKEEKIEIEKRLEERLTRENQSLLEGVVENGDIPKEKNVQEILGNFQDIKKLRDGLESEIDQMMVNRKEISENLLTQFSLDNTDLSQLTGAEKENVKKAANGFMKTTKNVLSIREIDYLMETMEPDGDGFGDMKNTHEDRQIEMEELQNIIKAIEEYQEYLEKLEALNEKSRVEQVQEVEAAVENLERIEGSDKKLFAALVGLGVVAGVVALCLSTGVAVPAFLTFKNIAIASGIVASVGIIISLQKQGELVPLIKKTAKVAGLAAALPIIGGGLCLDWFLNGEKTGKFIDSVLGVGLPSWAQDSQKS